MYVDEETQSGVEDIRNSTQRTISSASLNLVLSDVRSIAPPTNLEKMPEETVFDELCEPSKMNILEEIMLLKTTLMKILLNMIMTTQHLMT